MKIGLYDYDNELVNITTALYYLEKNIKRNIVTTIATKIIRGTNRNLTLVSSEGLGLLGTSLVLILDLAFAIE